jgi:hypothetical protein
VYVVVGFVKVTIARSPPAVAFETSNVSVIVFPPDRQAFAPEKLTLTPPEVTVESAYQSKQIPHKN